MASLIGDPYLTDHERNVLVYSKIGVDFDHPVVTQSKNASGANHTDPVDVDWNIPDDLRSDSDSITNLDELWLVNQVKVFAWLFNSFFAFPWLFLQAVMGNFEAFFWFQKK